MMSKFDFHCHSFFSDGLLSPEDLADYAVEREVGYLALTDHDTLGGISHLQDYINLRQLPLNLISGVEISSSFEAIEVHIVGLGIDCFDSPLNQALTAQIEARWQRAEAIDLRLQKARVFGVLQDLQTQVRQVVTRTHMARSLVRLNYAKDMTQAFKRYLGKQGKIKIDKDWMAMEAAISLIKQAGGLAILAHPTRYPLSNRKLSFLIQSFKNLGGDAIELAYSSLTKDKQEWLALQARQQDLLASSGSDFHYPGLKWSDLGRFPSTPSDIEHVKQQLFARTLPKV